MVPTHTSKSSGSDWGLYALSGLRDAGLRRGGARETVVEWLGRQVCCASAQEIHDGVRAEGRTVGLASVYRVLDTLSDLHLIQRVDLGDGVARFEAAARGSDHHHHLVCDACGRVEPFADEGLERSLERVAGRHGYTMAAHDVVVRGSCDTCQAA